jgi:hypothetical protein
MHSLVRFSVIGALLGVVSMAGATTPSTPPAPPAPAPAPTPDPNTIYIEQVTLGGTGCAAGSVHTNLITDTSDPAHPMGTIQFTFDNFEALIGPGTALADRTKNCNVAVTLHIPSGFSLAQIGAQYNGFAAVDPGVVGKQTTQYYFANPFGPTHYDTEVSNVPAELDENGNYSRNDQFLLGALVWSACGVNTIANVNSRVTLSYDPHATPAQRAFSTGIISLDTASFAAQQAFHFTWQQCH